MQFNLADLWECVADAVPTREALVAGPRRLTYAQLDERATRLAHALAAELDVQAHDHVAINLRNCVEYVETMLACYKLRAAPVNINYRYTEDEVAYLLKDSQAVGLITDAELPHPPAPWTVDIGEPYDALLSRGAATRDFAPRSADDLYLLYTGGTTGMPKGVMWRHEDILHATLGGGNPGGPPISRPEQIGETVMTNRAQRIGPFLAEGVEPPEKYVSLALGPLMHASGQWSALGALLGGGTSVLYVEPRMDMRRVLDLVATERVCLLTIVGDTSGRPLADALETYESDTSSVLLLGSGGSILSADTKARLLAAMPTVLGITEAVGSSEAPVQGVAVSRPGPQTAMAFGVRADTIVVDENLQRVEAGSGVIGRLATTGHIPLGYFNDPDKSRATFVELDGMRWSMPGDMATVEVDGTIRLLGRGAMCINTGGEKVYPEEVEAVVKAHPAVADVAVVGAPDERLGESVTVVIGLRPGASAPDLADVQSHCRGRLAGYKVPRRIVVVDEVVRSPAGKIDYRWARSQVHAGEELTGAP